MPSESNERMDRVEANLDRLMALAVQTAERQSTTECHLDHIRALARIAEAHQRRIENLESPS